MNEICAITVDLDDTLWPIGPVIEAAESKLHDWLTGNCPEIARSYSVESMRKARQRIADAETGISHDLTEVRRLSLEQIIVDEGGYPPALVDRAMAEFLKHRNEVDLYPDVLPFLSRSSESYPLLSISNGNADLKRIGLNELFVGHVSAIEVGAAKPDARLFRAASDLLDLPPEQILHIGDHPIQDILGASRVGMKTVWVNRTGTSWNENHRANYEVASLEQVLNLLPMNTPGDPE